MKQFLFFYWLLFGFGILTVTGQQQQYILGRVIDGYTDAPLSRVNLRSPNNKFKIQTDKNGYFRVEALLGDSLILSHLGYEETRVQIADGKLVNGIYQYHMLASSHRMDEVVVSTGYQTIPKERLTGSFDVIDNDLLNRQVTTNVLDRLDGNATAVLFDKRGLTNDHITVRGLSSIHATNSPLIVLDNFPYDGDISNINPNDVESITILKDAAAASIWGVRAGNGVIVITTKRGRRNMPLKVSVNSNYTITEKPKLFYQSRMSSSDFIDVEKYLFTNGFYVGAESDPDKSALSPIVELLIKKRDNPEQASEIDSQIEKLRTNDARREYFDGIYEKGLMRQTSLALRGGTDRLSYAFSVGYDRNDGSLKSRYKRTTLRSDNSYKITDHLVFEVGMQYIAAENKEGITPYDNLYFTSGKYLFPYARLTDDDGSPMAVNKDYEGSFKQEALAKGLLNWEYRPMEEISLLNNKTVNGELLVNTGMTYSFLKNLRAEIKYQYGTASSDRRNLKNRNSYEVRDLVNRYTQILSNGSLQKNIPDGDILAFSSNKVKIQSLRTQLNYSYSGLSTDLDVLVGTELRQVNSIGARGQTYGYDDAILTTSRVDYATSFPLYTGGSGRIPDATGYSDKMDRMRSFYLNGAYTYAKRYAVSWSARQDGSNLFGVKSNQKLVPLWSVGTSWNIGRESFYRFEPLPILKLRATYGFNGNVNNSLSALTTIRYSSGNLANLPYASMENVPNPDLRWEKVGVLNLGLDFESKGGLIYGSIEYYNKKGVDLFGKTLLDQTTGAINPNLTFEYITNSASMKGKGLDIQLHSVNMKRQLRWQTDLMYSLSTNKLVSYESDITDPRLYVNGGYAVNPIVGKPLFAIFSYRWGGLDAHGNPQGYLGNNLSTDYSAILNNTKAEELIYNGPAMPTSFGALRNSFTYKSVSLSFNITYRLGYYFVTNSINYNKLFNGYESHGDYVRRWQKAGDESQTSVPSMVYPNDPLRDSFYSQSSVLVEKGDHIRLQDINLSYIWKNTSRKTPFEMVQAYFYINNLGILWRANKKGLDPDYVVGLPAPRAFSLGLKMSLK